MAEGLNRVMLLGNLGADPELKMTNGGQAVLKLRLATSESYLDRNKVRQDRTEWHSVVVWGKRAEALGKFLTKGARIFVEGGLRTSNYEDKDGKKVYRTEIVASNIILGGRGGGGGGGAGGSDGEPMPIAKLSQEPSAPPYAKTVLPPPFSAEIQLPAESCKPT
ncbi:MAG TPA: single-stranded DNA-binding protein, partial [Polyangiaceae bacterium]|nr:single-stranded DNA-binding protein [Polyangiaceae bacterium]